MSEFAEILEYIPQRPPFVMVDRIVSLTEDQTVTSFEIKEDNLFCSNGIFYEAGMIENIAQTVAAGQGLRNSRHNIEPKIGYIGAVKNLSVFRSLQTGNTLNTFVNLVTRFENAIVAEGRIIENDELIVRCQINIFLIENPNL